MESHTRTLTRSRLIGVALGALAALAVAPFTGWLVRAQLASALRAPSLPPVFGELGMRDIPLDFIERSADLADARRRYAASRPDDYRVQLALAMEAPYGPVGPGGSVVRRVDNLLPLLGRFDDRPSLYANLLRMWNTGGVSVHRDDEELLVAPEDRDQSRPTARIPAASDLALFDEEAAAGERLDPDNAYFPFMRAAGLFAAHRDEEAAAALLRAGEKPAWREYCEDEVYGRWQLAEEGLGDRTALTRTAIAASLLLPQYAQLRAAARVATVRAMQAEQAGRPEEGLAIRRALLHCGALMRADCRTLIGNLVGVAVRSVATSRPGGAPAERKSSEASAMAWMHQHQDGYVAWLESIGHADEAPEVRREFAADDATKRDVRGLVKLSPFDEFASLGGWWIGGMLALTNALWLLALGGLAALLARGRFFRRRQPMPAAARWGAAVGVALPAGLALVSVVSRRPDAVTMVAVAGAGAAIALTRRRPGARLCVKAALIVALALTGTALVAAWTCSSVTVLTRLYAALSGAFDEGAHSVFGIARLSPGQSAVYIAGYCALVPLVPLLLTLAIGAASLVTRLPLSVGLIAGLRRCAAPLAAALLLGYGVLTVGTVRAEQRMDAGLEGTVRGEGRYLSQIAGVAWPGDAR